MRIVHRGAVPIFREISFAEPVLSSVEVLLPYGSTDRHLRNAIFWNTNLIILNLQNFFP